MAPTLSILALSLPDAMKRDSSLSDSETRHRPESEEALER